MQLLPLPVGEVSLATERALSPAVRGSSPKGRAVIVLAVNDIMRKKTEPHLRLGKSHLLRSESFSRQLLQIFLSPK